jgi:hypothetical protein
MFEAFTLKPCVLDVIEGMHIVESSNVFRITQRIWPITHVTRLLDVVASIACFS